MPRRREVPKREILPDPKYGNIELSKFMNVVMESGKKAVAENIIYGLKLRKLGCDTIAQKLAAILATTKLEPLAQRYQVWAVDAPGSGESDLAPADGSLAPIAKALADGIDRVIPAPLRFNLVGFSLGGNFMLRVASLPAATQLGLEGVIAVSPVLNSCAPEPMSCFTRWM